MTNFQRNFQRRWPDLRDPHVRALAWLLDAPDLMDAEAPCWDGRIATLGEVDASVAGWLHELDRQPQALHQHLAHQPSARLGRYAEKLLGFYLQQHGQLVAGNLQVRNDSGSRETLGEFDFLVRRPQTGRDANGVQGLEHWEFATKFYLLESDSDRLQSDAFVGPNLADSLGAKMRKIMQQQLLLSQHPAAQALLPAPVTSAQALVKGWLFYRHHAMRLPAGLGISAQHCRGFWATVSELQQRIDTDPHALRYLLLPRLSWLAPARVDIGATLSTAELPAVLEQQFQREPAPLMLALCEPLDAQGERAGDADASEVMEIERAFIVPDDWQTRAAERVRHALVRV
jgi:hypothetical protein